MKVTQMPPVHTANLVANSGNTAYGADVIQAFSFKEMALILFLLQCVNVLSHVLQSYITVFSFNPGCYVHRCNVLITANTVL